MKKFKLKKKDVYDLAYVVSSVVKDHSEKLDFKEVLHLQKMSNYFLDQIPDFKDKIEALSVEKDTYVKNANKKISAFKQELQKNTEKEGVLAPDFKEKLDFFVSSTLEDVQAEIDKELTPQYDALYKELGNEEVDLELEEEKHKMLVINFELYAKEKYTNKSRMVEVYEAITV
jgi:hypothetical protein